MLLLKEKPNVSEINDWRDIWLSDDKKAGYVAVSHDFKKAFYYGCNDKKKLVEHTKGKPDWYITLNAFDIDWNGTENNRRTENVKQIRTIGVDIDQYKLGLSIDEAIDIMNVLMIEEKIPEPNLVLTSRGIQIFYDIQGGASPEMAWLTSYITEQFIDKMKDIGADGNAKDLSRYMRVPESINSRNGATVEAEIWRKERYTLKELQSYTKPLHRFSNGYKKRFRTIQATDKALTVFYKVNYARLRDFETLIKLRQGDFTNMRNVLLYMYSYHQSFLLDSLDSVLKAMRGRFNDVYSRKDREMSDREFERTVKSAYKDAQAFFEHYKVNGYKLIYKQSDGIIKPYKTDNVIKRLEITEEEQDRLTTLVNPAIKRKHDRERRNKANREKGIKPMSEYNRNRRKSRLERVEQLTDLMARYPDKTQSEYAEMMDINRRTVIRLLKEINR